MAPIIPHLAEEIHHAYENEGQDPSAGSSVFMKKWEPLVRLSRSYVSRFARAHTINPISVAGVGGSDCGARNDRAITGPRRCIGTA